MKKAEAIQNAYMADLKSLDEIKGNWVGNSVGFLVGKDKDSKWLKAYSEAQEKAADQFRDCCAEDTLKYYKELASRVGGGSQQTDLYEWIQKLLKPVKSSDWKSARKDAKIVDIYVNKDQIITLRVCSFGLGLCLPFWI